MTQPDLAPKAREAATAAVEGGCLCGAVRYRAEGPPINQRVCHCRLCQRALGAAFNARMLFRLEAVRIDGPVATFPSSPALERGFCPTCGTTLFSRREGSGVIGLTTGSLDRPELFRPELQIWTASRQPWLEELSRLPACEEAAPLT